MFDDIKKALEAGNAEAAIDILDKIFQELALGFDLNAEDVDRITRHVMEASEAEVCKKAFVKQEVLADKARVQEILIEAGKKLFGDEETVVPLRRVV